MPSGPIYGRRLDRGERRRPEAPDQPPPRAADVSGHKWRRLSSTAFFVLILLVVGARAYKDLSRPEAWAYWKDLYFSPA